jgi:galactose mutarotase-like enzyme
MPESDADWIRLSSTALSARINPVGAQLSALQDGDGRDLLWNGDPAFWSGRAPFLFPIVGELANGRYRLGGETYALPRHGFARGKRFDVVESGADRAVFRLQNDDRTLPVYPFEFQLDIAFQLRVSTLSITTTLRNPGASPLPASFGFHPAFRWPLPYGQPRAAHFVEFADDEPDPVRRLDGAGLLLPEKQATPIKDRRLILDDSLFANDALILDQVRSRSASFGASHGPRIVVTFPNTPYLGIWSKPGADFLCIEPWHGIADPQGYSGDFTHKPGVFVVPAAGSLDLHVTISLS